MKYWPDWPFIGWDVERKTGSAFYQEIRFSNSTEDVSHFSLTLDLILEAYQEGVVFNLQDIEQIARTFHLRIFKPKEKGYLTRFLDGSGPVGVSDFSCGSFASMEKYDSTILKKSLKVYKDRYRNPNSINLDYEMGAVMLGWAKIAKALKEAR